MTKRDEAFSEFLKSLSPESSEEERQEQLDRFTAECKKEFRRTTWQLVPFIALGLVLVAAGAWMIASVGAEKLGVPRWSIALFLLGLNAVTIWLAVQFRRYRAKPDPDPIAQKLDEMKRLVKAHDCAREEAAK